MRRLAFTPNIGVGQIIIQKKLGYTIIHNKRVPVDKGKQIMGSIGIAQEEKLDEPSPKR